MQAQSGEVGCQTSAPDFLFCPQLATPLPSAVQLYHLRHREYSLLLWNVCYEGNENMMPMVFDKGSSKPKTSLGRPGSAGRGHFRHSHHCWALIEVGQLRSRASAQEPSQTAFRSVGGRPWCQPPFHTANILKAKTSSSSWHSAFSSIARSLPSGYLINSKSQETVKADLTTIRILIINVGSTLQCTKHPNIHGLKWSTYGCYAVRISKLPFSWRFPGGSVVKNLSANAGDIGLILGSGRSPGGGNRNPLSILAWEIPWTKEPGGLQLMGSQKSWIGLSDQTTNTILWRRIWISQALSD